MLVSYTTETGGAMESEGLIAETTRRNWPFLRDRRIDAYGPILRRYLGA